MWGDGFKALYEQSIRLGGVGVPATNNEEARVPRQLDIYSDEMCDLGDLLSENQWATVR